MEPVSTAALAALILATRSGAEELGREAGKSTWAGLGKLKALVNRKFSGNDEASQALVAVERRPDNEEAVGRLRDSLEECAATDGTFARELQQLIDDARKRPEYQQDSGLFINYGYTGKVNIFTSTIRVEHGGFNIH